MTPCRLVNICRYLRGTYRHYFQANPKIVLLRRWRPKTSPKRQSICKSVFSNLLPVKKLLKFFFYSRETPDYGNVNKTKKHLLAQEDYFSIVKGRIKIPAIFRGIFGIFRGMWAFTFVYFTISREKPKDVLRNLVWETPV
jgi:hypothetical protein